MLTQLAREIGSEMNKKWVGKEMEVMIVESGKNGSVVGRSNSYRPVVIKDRFPLGSFVKTKIVDATSTYLIGVG
jgi:2-methylthioadenine synthetase